MELLDGESLSARLRHGLPGTGELIHIAGQAAAALAASHAQGITHRDIKPDNIFLTARGGDPCFVKLLDFGIAKLHVGQPVLKTQTGAVIGTPAYMSPEQCAGHGHVDHRTDIYSLGAVMFEMASGRVPFPRDGFGEVLAAHLHDPAPRLRDLAPEVSPLVDEVVHRCLAKDPADRFASMGELRAALGLPATLARPPATGAAMPTVRASAAISIAPALPRPTTLSSASGSVEGRVSGQLPSRIGRARAILRAAPWALATAFGVVFAVGVDRSIRRAPPIAETSARAAVAIVDAGPGQQSPPSDLGVPRADLQPPPPDKQDKQDKQDKPDREAAPRPSRSTDAESRRKPEPPRNDATRRPHTPAPPRPPLDDRPL
jgi:serine/threonine protein kinase